MRLESAIAILRSADEWAIVTKVRNEHSNTVEVRWSDDAEKATPRLREAVRMAVRVRDSDRKRAARSEEKKPKEGER